MDFRPDPDTRNRKITRSGIRNSNIWTQNPDRKPRSRKLLLAIPTGTRKTRGRHPDGKGIPADYSSLDKTGMGFVSATSSSVVEGFSCLLDLIN